MSRTPLAVAVFLALVWGTPAQSETPNDDLPPLKIEDHLIFGCRNLEHVVEIVELVKKKGPEAARQKFIELNRRQSAGPLCSVARIGKVKKFEVVKTYHSIDFTYKQQIEVVVIRVEYDGLRQPLYITLERLIGEGQPI